MATRSMRCRPDFARSPPAKPHPLPRSPTTSGAFTACCFIPRSRTRRRARNCCAISPTRSPAAAATGRWRCSARRRSTASAARSVTATSCCGLSGGVDSAVAAALLHEAVGDQLTCIFVDTGMLRAGEAEEVVDLFRRHYNIPLVHRDAGDLFLAQARRRHRPRRKAQADRRHLYRRVRRGGAEARRRRVPRAGDALSRRDRVRRAPRAARRSRSNRTTMSAACPSA